MKIKKCFLKHFETEADCPTCGNTCVSDNGTRWLHEFPMELSFWCDNCGMWDLGKANISLILEEHGEKEEEGRTEF